MAESKKTKGKSTIRQQGRPVTRTQSGSSRSSDQRGDNRSGSSFGRMSGAPPRPPRRRSRGSGWLAFLMLLLILGAFIWQYQTRQPNEEPADSASFGWHTTAPETQPIEPETDGDSTISGESDGFPAGNATIEVHVLDVGQGLSVLLTCGEKSMLYDGGGRSTSSFVVSYLKNQGIEKLDYVIVSHYDADHLAGVIGALNVFGTETLIAPDYQADTKLFSSFQQMVQEKGISVTTPVPGDVYPFGAGEFQILAPSETSCESENDYSIVLRVSLGESSLLLTGDATKNSETELLEQDIGLQADVLIVGHHGSATSTSRQFLEAVAPSYAIISCGRDNDYGHPAKQVTELLKEKEIPLYRTDLQETILFTMTGQSILFQQDPCNDYTSGRELYGMTSNEQRVLFTMARAEFVIAVICYCGVSSISTPDPVLSTQGQKGKEIETVVIISALPFPKRFLPKALHPHPGSLQSLLVPTPSNHC